MMPSGDDHALLSQIASGDEGALQQLYQKYRPPARVAGTAARYAIPGAPLNPAWRMMVA